MRDSEGRLSIYEREFIYKPQGSQVGISAKMQIVPARIITDGREKHFLPAANEELIEEVLRKIFSDQSYGRHYSKGEESFVDFTLYMIAKELRARGHSRSLDQIKRSLEIMNGCRLSLHFAGDGNKATYKAAILPEISEMSRTEYMADPKGKWRVRLPFAYSKAINRLQFRQFNYATLMAMSSPLARWLHKLLSQRYTNAHVTSPYTILYSTIKDSSGLLNHSRETRNRESVQSALEELQERDVLLMFDINKSASNARDPKYTLTPTSTFVTEIIAANKRQTDQIKAMPRAALPSSR